MANNRKVRYNGGKETYFKCSSPEQLVLGKEYEVIRVIKKNLKQTNYTLSGLEGEYNAEWFDGEIASMNVYVAISNTVPITGQSYKCWRAEMVGEDEPVFRKCRTSIVKKVSYKGNNLYKVTTIHSTYYVTTVL